MLPSRVVSPSPTPSHARMRTISGADPQLSGPRGHPQRTSETPGTPIAHVASTALALLPAGASEPSRGAPPSPPRQGRMPPPRTPAPQPLRPWNRFLETPCPERPAGLRRRRPRSPAVKGRASLGAAGHPHGSVPRRRPRGAAGAPHSHCLGEPHRARLPSAPPAQGVSAHPGSSVPQFPRPEHAPPPPATATRGRRRPG